MEKILISFLCTFLAVTMSGCGKSDAERVQDYLEKSYWTQGSTINTYQRK